MGRVKNGTNKFNNGGMKVVRTILGDIAVADCGITLCHEHIIHHPGDPDPDLDIGADRDILVAELADARTAGVELIAEQSTVDMGRDVVALAEIAKACRIHIVAGTGFARGRIFSALVRESSVESLGELMSNEIERGIANTGLKAGIIGELGWSNEGMSALEEKIWKAAALAQKKTGAAIYTHNKPNGKYGVAQLDLLESLGVEPQRIVIGHMDDNTRLDDHLQIAKRGAWR